MLWFDYLWVAGATAMFVAAAAIVAYDFCIAMPYRRATASNYESARSTPLRWRTGVALIALAWAPLLVAIIVARCAE